MKVFKINGLWCLATDSGKFICSLLGQRQPRDRDEAERQLKEKLTRELLCTAVVEVLKEEA